MTRMLPLLLLLAACGQDYGTVQQERALDSFPYVDCGVVVPADREICTVPLFSKADGKVQIFDIRTEDVSTPEGGVGAEGAFIVTPSEWQAEDCGEGDCRYLEGYDDHSDEDTLPLSVIFAPLVEGFYHAELTIWSNDTESTESLPLPDSPDLEKPIWRVQLRGYSRKACGRIFPTFVDYGRKDNAGGQFNTAARVENCGIVTLEVGGSQESGTGAEEMQPTTNFPLYVLPSFYEDVAVSWVVGVETNGEPTPVEDVITFSSNSEVLNERSLTVIGNDCEQSVDESWDADADGWFSCGGDCDDLDPDVNPSKTERAGNGEDDDCDDEVDEGANPVGSDDDGDGYTESQGDCDDAAAAISPDAVEEINQVDDDCNGYVDDDTERYDDDADGYAEREGDCDDADATVNPAAAESADLRDNDCDGIVDEGGRSWDDDEDGTVEDEADTSMSDCDDRDPWVYVGAFEFCDGYDNDCDGVADEGPEDDAPDGACAFLPDRRGEESEDTASADADAGGCATGGGAPWGLGVLLAGLAAGLRARRR